MSFATFRDMDDALELGKTEECYSKTINNIEFKFGSLLNPESKNWVPIIIDMVDGILYNIFAQNNPMGIKELNRKVFPEHMRSLRILESGMKDIPFVVAIKYINDVNKWGLMMEEICHYIYDIYNDNISEYTLVLPTLGTNNGITYYKCALGIFYGIKSCISNEAGYFNKLNKIVVLTPWSDNQMNTSCRVINHIFNLIKISEQTIDERECLICCDNKISIIMKCGHYVVCITCINKIAPTCPLCKVNFCNEGSEPVINRDYYECHKYNNIPEYKCCEKSAENPKMQTIYVPCGHANINCSSCYDESNKTCKVCEKDMIIQMKFFV